MYTKTKILEAREFKNLTDECNHWSAERWVIHPDSLNVSMSGDVPYYTIVITKSVEHRHELFEAE